MAYEIVEVDPAWAEATEPLGTKPKYWYRDQLGAQNLLKVEDRGTGEDWAEKIACELARRLGLPHVEYELAIEVGTGRRGVACPNMSPPPRSLVLGNQLLLDRDPTYPSDGSRYRVGEHTVAAVCGVLEQLALPPSPWRERLPSAIRTARDVLVGYVMLDAFVANQDRHHENWGAVVEGDEVQLAPTFDHGAALARNLNDAERTRRLNTRDKRPAVPAFARRASSAIYRNRGPARSLSTLAAFRAFAERAPKAAVIWLDHPRDISTSDVDDILDEVPVDRMSEVAKLFTMALLCENQRRLLAGEAE